MPGLLSHRGPIGLSALSPFSPPSQSALAKALSNYPARSRKPALNGLAQCLTPQKRTYLLSVEIDIETKLALDRGETVSLWRCW